MRNRSLGGLFVLAVALILAPFHAVFACPTAAAPYTPSLLWAGCPCESSDKHAFTGNVCDSNLLGVTKFFPVWGAEHG